MLERADRQRGPDLGLASALSLEPTRRFPCAGTSRGDHFSTNDSAARSAVGGHRPSALGTRLDRRGSVELRAQRDGQRAPGRSAPIGGPPGRFARASRPETAGFLGFFGIIATNPKFEIRNPIIEESSMVWLSNFRAGNAPTLLSCSF